MNYIELIVSVEPKDQGGDVLITRLAELDFESFMESENGFSAFVQEKNYDAEKVTALFSDHAGFFKISYSSKIIEQQNWNKIWENSFQPIDIDGKCYIHAPFHEAKTNFLYDVIIEPKMSFGTGHHETTQLMLQKMMSLNTKNKSVLDMGCGTGVLAIVSSMMGSNTVTAVDTDEWSYENTLENLQKNNINNVLVHKGDAQILEGKIFHTILANINKNVLLTDMNNYSQSLEKNGNLVLSGFFETDINEITAKALELNLKVEDRAVCNKWAMLHFIKLG